MCSTQKNNLILNQLRMPDSRQLFGDGDREIDGNGDGCKREFNRNDNYGGDDSNGTRHLIGGQRRFVSIECPPNLPQQNSDGCVWLFRLVVATRCHGAGKVAELFNQIENWSESSQFDPQTNSQNVHYSKRILNPNRIWPGNHATWTSFLQILSQICLNIWN